MTHDLIEHHVKTTYYARPKKMAAPKPCDPNHPQWKRRRYWNYLGAAVGLAAFAVCGVKILLGDQNPQLVAFSYSAGGLFLISSGIYAATAVFRKV